MKDLNDKLSYESRERFKVKVKTVGELLDYLSTLDRDMEIVAPEQVYENFRFPVGLKPYVQCIRGKDVLIFA